jgi:hypothetical protein
LAYKDQTYLSCHEAVKADLLKSDEEEYGLEVLRGAEPRKIEIIDVVAYKILFLPAEKVNGISGIW